MSALNWEKPTVYGCDGCGAFAHGHLGGNLIGEPTDGLPDGWMRARVGNRTVLACSKECADVVERYEAPIGPPRKVVASVMKLIDGKRIEVYEDEVGQAATASEEIAAALAAKMNADGIPVTVEGSCVTVLPMGPPEAVNQQELDLQRARAEAARGICPHRETPWGSCFLVDGRRRCGDGCRCLCHEESAATLGFEQ